MRRNTLHIVGVSECAIVALTLCDPMDCSPPGSSVRGILQARILQWVAISFSAHCRKESTTPCQPHRLVRRLGSPRRPSVAAGHAQSRAALILGGLGLSRVFYCQRKAELGSGTRNTEGSGSQWASRVALVAKSPPSNAGDVEDVGSISGSGRSPGGGRGNAGEPHGHRSLMGYGAQGHRESNTPTGLGTHTGMISVV